MPFAPDYVRIVLNENFEDAKALFLAPLMAIHYAHLAMLAEQRIVSPEHARAIRAALDGIDLRAVGTTAYDGTCEDLFFYLERLVVAGCGEEAAGRLRVRWSGPFRLHPQARMNSPWICSREECRSTAVRPLAWR